MWCPGEGGGRGRCVTSEEVRLDRPASELADCGRPHASRGAALLEQGGPSRGRGGGLGGQGLSLLIDLFLLRSVLLEETNKLTTPRPQDRTLGGLHTAAERGQPAEQEQRQG